MKKFVEINEETFKCHVCYTRADCIRSFSSLPLPRFLSLVQTTVEERTFLPEKEMRIFLFFE
jgi:SH3-like domain-containing protein